MDSNSDYVLFDVIVFYPDGAEVPPGLRRVAKSLKVNRSGYTVVRLASAKLATDEDLTLQEKLDKELAAVAELLSDGGVEISTLVESGGEVRVAIDLVPNEGGAGIYIPAATLGMWASMGAHLMVSARPGRSWTRDVSESYE